MCRIVGIVHTSDAIDYSDIVQKMTRSLSYAGPDNQGVYTDESITFGHRRLSIIDLSTAANQPMQWEKYVITYNGEIYNFQSVKKELSTNGYTFFSNSDTEVVVKAFDYWSYDAVQKFRGMFAFALWDTIEKKLLLCRDRVGAKPLFWYQDSSCFIFASELKVFHHFPNFDKTIDLNAVSLFLQQGYISAPHCIFEKVKKLEPGSFLEIDVEKNVRIWKYWGIEKIYNQSSVSTASESEIAEQLESILKESFKLRLVSDVPVGMFLSGGIDSSLVTAMLQKSTNRQIKTFTIGFEEPKYNEAPYAKAIAQQLETDHIRCWG